MTTRTFASAADTKEQRPRLVELAYNVYGFISDHDPNCGFVVGEDYVVVIDTRATPTLARELRAAIESVTDKPIRYVFLSHYHAVRVLGASAFPEATIIASSGTLDWIETRGEADMESEVRRFPRLFKGVEEVPGLTRPELVFNSGLTLKLGDRDLELVHLGRGHSKGDSIAWLPDCGVLFSGDLVENKCGVYAGDGFINDWVDTLRQLKLYPASILIPGRGAALLDRQSVEAAIAATSGFLTTLKDSVIQARAAGADTKACIEEARRVMTPLYGEWPVFAHVLPFDVVRMIEELEGGEEPSLWSAERDQKLWDLVNG